MRQADTHRALRPHDMHLFRAYKEHAVGPYLIVAEVDGVDALALMHPIDGIEQMAVNRSQLHVLAVGHIHFHHHPGIALLPVANL